MAPINSSILHWKEYRLNLKVISQNLPEMHLDLI